MNVPHCRSCLDIWPSVPYRAASIQFCTLPRTPGLALHSVNDCRNEFSFFYSQRAKFLLDRPNSWTTLRIFDGTTFWWNVLLLCISLQRMSTTRWLEAETVPQSDGRWREASSVCSAVSPLPAAYCSRWSHVTIHQLYIWKKMDRNFTVSEPSLGLNGRDAVHSLEIHFDPLLDAAHHLLFRAPGSAVPVVSQPSQK